MDYRLPTLTVVLFAAATGIARGVFSNGQETTSEHARPRANAVSPTDEARTDGSQLMRAVIERISSHPSITAKVRHRTGLFEQKMVGSGVYLQQQSRNGTLSRFSLSFPNEDRMISLLHICDGRFLWIRDSSDEQAQLGRVDLRRLRDAVVGGDNPPAFGSIPIGAGLSQTLASIEANFDCARPYPLTFQEVPVWAIACRWKPDRLTALLPKRKGLYDQQGRLNTEKLPAQLPDRVFLLVGRDDLFPYHIDFRRTATEGQGGKPRESSESLVTMELFEVQIGTPIDPTAFICRPGDIEIQDWTDDYVSKLRGRSQSR